jgi:L-lysine exporter family protein LysE/ArgO
MEVFVEGFLLQASLILALGAQNLFVLDSGLKRQRPLLVASLCSLCDLLLILLGVLGAATIFVQYPLLKITFGLLGCGFLLYYGILKLCEAWNPAPIVETKMSAQTLKQTVLATLGFSLLNPHVYLDTVVLIGGYSSQFDQWRQRLEFGAGAGVCSILWFFGLALVATSFSRLLHNPRAMRAVSLVSGIILLALAFILGQDVLGWI